MYTIADIISFIHCERTQLADQQHVIGDLAYDTRKILHGQKSLFFALAHVRDGHSFIAEAYEKGVSAFVISQDGFDISPYPDASFLWVKDTLKALQELAAHKRADSKATVIAITGSNGKTVVKEWLTQLMQDDFRVYQSPKSYNSQIGVALSLWNITDEYDYAIIEAGISRPGEMDELQAMIKPQLGIFTNIGIAHASGFVSQTEKLQEKLRLFKNNTDVIYHSKYPLGEFLSANDHGLFSFGTAKGDFVEVISIENAGPNSTRIEVRFADAPAVFVVPFTDKGSIENILLCVTTLAFLGYHMVEITERLARLKPLEMRLQLKRGKNGCSIIDDSYSNDFASLQIALDFFIQQKQHQKKTLILTGMEGLDEKLENKLYNLLTAQPISRIILVGKELTFLAKLDRPTVLYHSTAELIAGISELRFERETILIKGSRYYHLEDLSALLTEKTHETVLEINLKSMEYNLQRYRALVPKGVKVMAMVKAFSYGSGSYEVANLLQYNKVDYLTVAFADEGVELRQNGITLPIMVLSPDERVFESLLANKLEPEIYSFRILNAFVGFLRERGIKDFPVHIKVDTGMHRLGFLNQDIDTLGLQLKEMPEIRIASVFSHLAAVGDPNHETFTKRQIDCFYGATTQLRQALGYDFIRHIVATSGIVHLPEAYFDMVRLGIGLYGISMDGSLQLDPVNTLKTTITQIKNLKAGESVGYDRKGFLDGDARIATVKIGYADGYDRRFGNGVGKMSIRGQLVKTVGNICMDMCMLDVTDIEAFEEDEVIVFPDVMQAARSIETIPYELLVSISSRVKRVYFYG